MSRNWIAFACAEHVRLGRKEGIMQVCHGKAAPLRRVQPGDGVAYYSPTETLGGRDKVQAFTAIGIVRAGAPYQVDMGETITGVRFQPFRRNVDWLDADAAPIALLGMLEFAARKPSWGFQLRFGLFAISDDDFALIAAAMKAKLLARLSACLLADAALLAAEETPDIFVVLDPENRRQRRGEIRLRVKIERIKDQRGGRARGQRG